jgi:hypothetical protein
MGIGMRVVGWWDLDGSEGRKRGGCGCGVGGEFGKGSGQNCHIQGTEISNMRKYIIKISSKILDG